MQSASLYVTYDLLPVTVMIEHIQVWKIPDWRERLQIIHMN